MALVLLFFQELHLVATGSVDCYSALETDRRFHGAQRSYRDLYNSGDGRDCLQPEMGWQDTSK
jgi:hypothetical protein